MTMRAVVSFVAPASSLVAEAETGTGFRVTVDSSSSDPQRAASPREMVLVGLGGCTGMDVASILAKKRQAPDGYRVTVEGDTAPDPPRVFTTIRIEHHVSGAVEEEAVRRAIELSATRYCPVSAMLSNSVRLEHRYRLSPPGQPERSGLVVVTGPDGTPTGMGERMHGGSLGHPDEPDKHAEGVSR